MPLNGRENKFFFRVIVSNFQRIKSMFLKQIKKRPSETIIWFQTAF